MILFRRVGVVSCSDLKGVADQVSFSKLPFRLQFVAPPTRGSQLRSCLVRVSSFTTRYFYFSLSYFSSLSSVLKCDWLDQLRTVSGALLVPPEHSC